MAYKAATPFTTALTLFKPTAVNSAYGVQTRSYSSEGEPFFGSVRSFGGTDSIENGVLSIIDTAVIETWYRPDITPGCRVVIAESGAVYEVIGTPEDIEMRHRYLRLRVQRVKGGA